MNQVKYYYDHEKLGHFWVMDSRADKMLLIEAVNLQYFISLALVNVSKLLNYEVSPNYDFVMSVQCIGNTKRSKQCRYAFRSNCAMSQVAIKHEECWPVLKAVHWDCAQITCLSKIPYSLIQRAGHNKPDQVTEMSLHGVVQSYGFLSVFIKFIS